MNHLIRLTEFETGHTVLVDPSKIIVCWRLSAVRERIGEATAIERGERTRIDIGRASILVCETPEEILAATAAAPAPAESATGAA